MEHVRQFLHLFFRHTVRFKSHATGIDVNLGSLGQHVNLVECIHYIGTYGKHTVFFLHYHIVIVQFLQCSICQFY